MTDPTDTLESALREHYQQQSLDPATLARLQRIARTPPPARMRFTHAWRFAAAAALLIVAMLGWQEWRREGNVQLAQNFVADVVRQHQQDFRADVMAEDFDQVQTRMSRLNFKPIEPQRCKQDDYRVVGARYATLAGKPVAQIRLAYVEGPQMSLYEMPAGSFPHVREGTTEIGGTPVTVWQENGLLMALAGTPAE